SGQRDSRTAKMRPKRLKRPKGRLLSLFALWSLLLLSPRASRMARYLPMGLSSRRKPKLDRATASVPAFRPGAPLGRQQRERRANAVSRAVPPEQVADCRPAHAFRRVLESACNLVGNRVAQQVAKDEGGGALAILPEGKGRLEVRHVDQPRPVEQ